MTFTSNHAPGDTIPTEKGQGVIKSVSFGEDFFPEYTIEVTIPATVETITDRLDG